jgi:hypothetical protein
MWTCKPKQRSIAVAFDFEVAGRENTRGPFDFLYELCMEIILQHLTCHVMMCASSTHHAYKNILLIRTRQRTPRPR